jgi:hypothetical protein
MATSREIDAVLVETLNVLSRRGEHMQLRGRPRREDRDG